MREWACGFRVLKQLSVSDQGRRVGVSVPDVAPGCDQVTEGHIQDGEGCTGW